MRLFVITLINGNKIVGNAEKMPEPAEDGMVELKTKTTYHLIHIDSIDLIEEINPDTKAAVAPPGRE